MKAIEKIIFNVLASRRSVTLPGVGTLAVERRPAVVLGKDVKAPVNRVVFSGTEAEDVATLPGLMEFMGVEPQQAQANYDEWLNEVSDSNGLTIDGVGTLRQNFFTPSTELEQILNPTAAALADGGAGRSKRSSNCLTNILLAIAILLLLALGGLYLYNTHCGGAKLHSVAEATEQPVQVEAPAAPIEPVAPAVENSAKRFHVVAGTFAHEYNADAMIRWYKINYPELTPEKITYKNGLTIVSLFSTDDQREAVAKMQSLAYRHYKPDYWVCEMIVFTR